MARGIRLADAQSAGDRKMQMESPAQAARRFMKMIMFLQAERKQLQKFKPGTS